jgi:hypothetical protein
MAVINRKNLVLRGVRVVNDVVTVSERAGLNPARKQTVAMSHSPRRPHGGRQTMRPTTDLAGAADCGTAKAVSRAGRLERCAGNPSRCLAITAGRTILSRWSRYSLSYPQSQLGQQRPGWLKRGQAEPAFTGRSECTRRPLGERGAC